MTIQEAWEQWVADKADDEQFDVWLFGKGLIKPKELDLQKIKTTATADDVNVGDRGCFADTLADLMEKYANDEIESVEYIYDKFSCFRFKSSSGNVHCLFYPL